MIHCDLNFVSMPVEWSRGECGYHYPLHLLPLISAEGGDGPLNGPAQVINE